MNHEAISFTTKKHRKQLVRNYITLIIDGIGIVFLLWMITLYPPSPFRWAFQILNICLAIIVAMFAIKLLSVTIALRRITLDLEKIIKVRT